MRQIFYGGVALIFTVCLLWMVSCTVKQPGTVRPPSGATAAQVKGAGQEAKEKSVKKEVVTSSAKKAPPKRKLSPVEALYQAKVKPLSPIECARCHYSIYNLLKKDGGKHRQVCTNCHKEYHRKKAWQKIKPKCNKCHGFFHGKKVTDCESCHQEPHTPRRIPLEAVSGKCGLCHSKETTHLKNHVSAHQDVGCEGCHSDRHGRVPKCFECHEPHVKGQTIKECLECHNPHMPLNIRPFAGLKVKNQVCGSCHDKPLEKLGATTAKHGKLACTFCHPKHGLKPKCEGCHGKPHAAKLHQKFPHCLKCHVDPHSLGKAKVAVSR